MKRKTKANKKVHKNVGKIANKVRETELPTVRCNAEAATETEEAKKNDRLNASNKIN